MTKSELQNDAYDALKEAVENLDYIDDTEYPDEVDRDDINITGLADDLTPIYTSDLLDLLRSNFGTFDCNNSGTEFDSVSKLVSYNCYEYLCDYLYEIFPEVVEDVLLEKGVEL